jgi:release factor glutamine methyltransferase
MLDELLQGKPLQYVTGKAYFMERLFDVNEQVLIPRPETEELVIWILNDYKSSTEPINILDIGTGSGCIPISLKLEMPTAHISSCDISAGALEVAQKNARRLNAEVHFIALDFLDNDAQLSLPLYDIIVSNPPYIPQSEELEMHLNVKGHEPGTALFVPDNDPLLFYRAIAHFGKTHLNDNGVIYCELHRDFAQETKELFIATGYKNVEIKKDMHDNWRMIKAKLN